MAVEVGRLCFWKDNEADGRRKMNEVRRELLARRTKIYQYGTGSTEYWHFGNFCLPGVPLDVARELAEKYDLDVDMVRSVITDNDFNHLKVGDRVTVELPCATGTFTGKGTVVNKNDDVITVRKYKCIKQHWRIRLGDEGLVTLGWQ